MKKSRYLLFLFIVFNTALSSQTLYPKRELRAVWMATVSNVDYPSNSGLTSVAQRNEYISYLDKFKQIGINTVYVQVRPSCDAFYENPNEPWSQWLSGTQGIGPSPVYDPLDFYVSEAHKRGMELHAWINPYRSVVNILSSSISYSHISVLQPSWNVTYNNIKILNPGLEAVRNYVKNVIMYIVNKYDIDGVHFDDYFYPYPQSGYTFNDAAAFAADPRGFTNKDDWRRDNVNIFIAMVHDSIKASKKHVKFGVSPFGIWKSGIPSGITGLSSYYEIYCDPINWLSNQKIDYVMPQLYWALGGAQDFNALSDWWGNQAQLNDRHCYAGIATYRMSSANWSVTEIKNQINTSRNYNNKVQGYSFFSATQIKNNVKGINDTLIDNQHKYKCLVPRMPWLDSIAPNPPQNVTASVVSSHVSLNWQLPPAAIDGDSAKYFVIYRFPDSTSVNLNDAKAIIGITTKDTTGYKDLYSIPFGTAVVYVVTACDRLHNESVPVQINACNVCITATNTNCGNAIQLISDTSCYYTTGTLWGADSSSLPKPTCDGFSNPAKKDVYYYFIANSSEHTIEVKPTGFGADAVDAVVSVYSGVDCAALTEVACKSGGGSGGNTKLLDITGLTIGQKYWIRLYDYGSIDPVYPEFKICVTSDVLSEILIDAVAEDKISVYPNPTLEFINIDFFQIIDEITIRNSMGQIVLKELDAGSSVSLDVTSLAKGFYYIEIKNKELHIVQKFIKQ